MTTTLLLVRHAATGETARALPAASGRAADPAGPGLDGGGRAAAAGLRGGLPVLDLVWSSHARRAVETATLAVREPDARLADLAELDFGRWAGGIVADLHRTESAAVEAWMADPRRGPPDGESLVSLRRRARRVLDRAAITGGVIGAITHGGFIRAALLVITGAPSRQAWTVDVPPASVTTLIHHEGAGWQVRGTGWQPTLVVA